MRGPLALRPCHLLPLAILIVAVVARITASDLLERLSLFFFDIYQKADPREAGDAPIRIVDIDDNSLKEIGQWPWSRNSSTGCGMPVQQTSLSTSTSPNRIALLPNCCCLCSPETGSARRRLRGCWQRFPIPIGGRPSRWPRSPSLPALSSAITARHGRRSRKRVCLCRERPARPCRQLSGGGCRFAGIRSRGRRQWLSLSIGRLGPCGAPRITADARGKVRRCPGAAQLVIGAR
jgi:hypothetical protein